MRSLILLAFGAVLPALLSAQTAGTFFSTFDAERGSVVAPARDGRIWLGGMKDERVLLAKLTFNGKILEKHSIGFEGSGLDFEHLTDIFEDSDGMLVGCGNFENDNAGRGFIFRYNPVTRNMVWSQIVRSNVNFIYGITELGPGGDFVVYANPHAIAGNDAELLRLHRATGQIVSGKAKRYSLGSSDNITQAVYHKGALYTCGRFTIDNGFNADPSRMRNGICRVDTATLEPVWARIGPYPTSASVRLSGRDIIIDNEAIITTLSGDATGPDLFSSTIFLQKNDLNGNLLWARQYDLPEWNGEFAEEVISLPDGYLLYGHDLLSDTSRLFLLKTDKSGFPVSAVKIDVDVNEKFPEVPARSKIMRLGDALFLTAMSQNDLGQTQGILAKTDLDGWVSDSCGFFQKTAVNLVAMPTPVSEAVIPPVSASPATVEGATVTVNQPDLVFSAKCGAGGTCPTLPDLRITLDSFTCVDGYSVLHYSFCNLGGQPYLGSAFFGLYDKNPFTDTAMLITTVIHPGLSLQPGDCEKGSIVSSLFPPVIFELDTFSKLYAMIGIHLNMPIPVKISDFPFTPNKPECSYANNLDSITVPEKICGTCENPTTFVKKLGDAQRRELAYSMCKSRDGNIYLAGKQDNNPMIAKLTPLGEPIWVRNFPDNPNFQIEIAEIMEDSERKLVFCGTQGTSPSNRQAVAMRYDPSADVVLWFRAYPAHRSVASGILEKVAGGNFILCSNSQEFTGGMLKTRSELLELDRISGDVVPTLAVRYLGEPNIRFESMAMSNGSLYAAGSRQAGPQQSLTPVFAKISPGTGQPDWVFMTNPDTTVTMPTVTSPGSMLLDNDFAIIAGIDDIAPAGSGNNNFLYLEKRRLDGTLIWMKRYDIQIFPEDVIRVGNSYVIFGFFSNDNKWGMLKVDVENGNFILAKTLTAGTTVSNFSFIANRQSLALHIGTDILMGDHTQDGNGSGDLLLVRTDSNIGLDDTCSLLQNVQIAVQDLPAKSQPLTIETVPALTTAFTSTASFQADSLNVTKLCPQCLFENCPDVTFEVSSIFCSADSALFYKTNICNTGDQLVNKPFEVTFYDKNPLTEAAAPVWSIVVNEPLEPGKCREISWLLPGIAAQYSRLYTLAGVGSNTATPIDLDSFPFQQGFAECRYGNNLDSFVVQTPICDGCENPTTFIKTMGRVDRSEQGYSFCTASDGNVYLAGRQGRNPMIAKMTPNGDMIWVRNFPAGTFFETVELTEIIEDSEGKIVICGTEGLSPDSRMAVAMRYDPVADQVLWFKQYPEQNPQAAGIFEKTPGGNLILYSFSDEFFSGGLPPFTGYYKARSEVWELDRTTGEVLPGLATIFNGDPSVYFQDMVIHNGSLYTAGSWSLNGQGRMLLAKLSADNGTPDWMQGTLPDTTQVTQLIGYSNLLVDDEQLVVFGHGVVNFNTPAEIKLVYMSNYALDGSLLWIKGYEINLYVEDVVTLPDGYAIFGRMADNSWGMIKTDKDGNLLVVKKITLPVASGIAYRYYRQNELLRLPDHLLMVDDYKPAVYPDIVLFKTDYDFNLDDTCSLIQDLQVKTNIQPAKTNPIFTPFEPYTVAAVATQTTFQTDSLSITQLCPKCPCLDKPDITYRIDSVYCAAADGIVARVRVCNLGQVSPTAGFNLTFYDKNPLTGAATPLYSTFVPDKPGFGDCIEYALPLDTALLKYPKIYTLAGVWGDVQTPVSPDGFPYPNGFAECDYANNLDSFDLKLPAPQTPELGPNRSICAGKTTTLDAGGGYVSYKWLNGPAAQTFTVSVAGAYSVEVTDACGRILRDTVQVTVLPQPAPTTVTIPFYPGDTVVIGGTPYTQPGSVVQTLISASGCDSVLTTILQPVATGLDIQCPANLTVTLPPNQTTALVNYNQPTVATTCPNPSMVINLVQGPWPGTPFPLGATSVCYEVVNQCGIRDTCCFTVTVQQTAPADPCQPNTFIKLLGEVNTLEDFSCLRASGDGNLYLAGQKGDRFAICKMTPEGAFLWTRAFATTPNEPVAIAEIIVDSDGMIVGSGMKGDKMTARGFAFRYDPVANQILWAQQIGDDRIEQGGILEKSAGGNYLLYQNPYVDSTTKNVEVLELDRLTGQILPAFAKRYSLAFFDQTCTAMVAYNGAIYAAGNAVGLFNARRILMMKMDAGTGEVLWSAAAHHSWAQPSYFKGTDLIADSGGLLYLYYGNQTSYTLDGNKPTQIFLQKNSPNTEVLWVKKYFLSAPPKELIAVPDGYVILAGDTDHYLLKTDKNGNLLNTVRIKNPAASKNNNSDRQNQMERIGGHLFAADVALFNSTGDQYTTLLKTDLNLGLEFDCANVDLIQVTDSSRDNHLTNYPLYATVSPAQQHAISVASAPAQMALRETCPVCPDVPDDPCDVKTPPGCFRYELLGIQFDSLGRRRYRVRVTNTCASPLAWVSIQLPKGVTAAWPKEGAVYTAPGGNTYAVRNPNFSPFYSIRYQPLSGSLNSGASDVFEYTLPQQSAPVYIHVAAKLTDGAYSEAHLNTYNCPVQPYNAVQNAAPAIPRNPEEILTSAHLAVRPNPTGGQLFVDVRQWSGQQLQIQVLNAQGQLVLDRRLPAGNEWLELDLPEGLANGLYFLSVQPQSGARSAVRFVLER